MTSCVSWWRTITIFPTVSLAAWYSPPTRCVCRSLKSIYESIKSCCILCTLEKPQCHLKDGNFVIWFAQLACFLFVILLASEISAFISGEILPVWKPLPGLSQHKVYFVPKPLWWTLDGLSFVDHGQHGLSIVFYSKGGWKFLLSSDTQILFWE